MKDLKKCPIPGNWILNNELSDEFDGTELDSQKWFDYAPNWRGRKTFLFRKKNISLKDGCAYLCTSKADVDEMSPEDVANGVLPYESPIIKSKQKVLYGYFECKSKGSAAEIRDAFWLYDPLSDRLDEKYRTGNCSEEIDIYEFIGKYKNPRSTNICSHVHRFATPYVEGVVNTQKTKLPDEGGFVEKEWYPCDDFHTYGLLWTVDEIVWYCDGVEYSRRKNDYFHTPLHVMFDTEVAEWQGSKIANHKDSDFPAYHVIEYFRHYVMG